jgi:hypothetical protein
VCTKRYRVTLSADERAALERLVELGIATSISYETVRRTLKKTSSSRG